LNGIPILTSIIGQIVAATNYPTSVTTNLIGWTGITNSYYYGANPGTGPFYPLDPTNSNLHPSDTVTLVQGSGPLSGCIVLSTASGTGSAFSTAGADFTLNFGTNFPGKPFVLTIELGRNMTSTGTFQNSTPQKHFIMDVTTSNALFTCNQTFTANNSIAIEYIVIGHQ
jgi:hypothetical protein